MADVYRSKVEKLAAALEGGNEQGAARASLRGFVDRIVIPEDDGLLQVVGNLGLMLEATNEKADGEAVGPSGCGACNRRYLQLWSAAG